VTPHAADPRLRDRRLLYAAALLRAIATGMVGVVLGLHLAASGLDAARIGIVVSAGIAGVAAGIAVATFRVDLGGRRRFLILLAVLGAAGALALAFAPAGPASPVRVVALAACAFLGMLNGMGRDRGAALAIEQALLPATAADRDRTAVVAWYNVLQDVGHAVGSLLAGLPELLRRVAGFGDLEASRAPLVLYAVIMVVTVALYVRLSPAVEAEAPSTRPALGARAPRLAPESRRIVHRISALFAIDSLGGGFLTTALLSYFFFTRFGAGEAVIGALFFGARLLNALSHLGAAWLAKRIGLVNTMVFTHIPSSVLLASVAFAPTFPVAAILFLLREGLVEMDVPTRQSYVLAVVRPEERLYASGITTLVRTGSWAVAPAFAGLLMQGTSMATPLFVGAGMKIAYDLLLWRAFRNVRPPEERGGVS
jgi:MFS family permease